MDSLECEDVDVDEFSDDEFWENIDWEQFDLVTITENERQQLIANAESEEEEDSGQSEDFDASDSVPLFYYNPKFEWSSRYTETDRRPFTKEPGPVHKFHGVEDLKAINFFQRFYSDEIFADIAKFTNANAARKIRDDPDNNKGQWSDVTVAEMKVFYGLLLMMDIYKCENDRLYWDQGQKYFMLGTNIPNVMKRDRFMQIRRYLHFSEDAPVPSQASHASRDKLAKIRYIVDSIRSAFQREYVPHKEITIDEAMIPFKGRLAFKQYMREKPVKFGIKMFVLADARNGYCFNLEVYAGKHGSNLDCVLSLSSKIVIELSKPLLNEGRFLFTDNFYTSPALAHYLVKESTYLTGTVRTDRKGFLKALVVEQRAVKTFERGSQSWLQSGPVIATRWRDNKMVYYLSTAYPPEQEGLTATRREKDGTRIFIPSSPIVQAYASYYKGVDLLDQMTRLNKSKRSLRWYRKVERKLFECAVYNSFLLMKDLKGTLKDNGRPMTSLEWRLDLAHQLVGDYQQATASVGRPRREANMAHLRLDRQDHLPVAAPTQHASCVVCNEKHKKYAAANPSVPPSDNPFKRRKSSMKCAKCNVVLCCNPSSTCFLDFHTKVNFMGNM